MPEPTLAFVIMQFGDPGTPERARADEVADYVVRPAVQEFDLEMYRADRDPTPGQITPQILKKLIAARVVIADLTAPNPNVYYELGVAHSFSRPVVVLCDQPSSLAFDTKDERIIPLGSAEFLRASDADRARKLLIEALKVVLAEGHRASSVLSEVAVSRSIDALAPEDPLASELALIRVEMQDINQLLRRRASDPSSYRRDIQVLKDYIENEIANGDIRLSGLVDLHNSHLPSNQLRNWLDDQISSFDEHPQMSARGYGTLASDEALAMLREKLSGGQS